MSEEGTCRKRNPLLVTHRFLLVALCSVVVGAPVYAFQQQDPWRFDTPIAKKEFAAYLGELGADNEVQADLLWTLYADASTQLQQARDQYREELASAKAAAQEYYRAHPERVDVWMEEGHDFGVIAANVRFLERRQTIRRRFEVEAAKCLDPWQVVAWKEIQLRLRRERLLREINRNRRVSSTFDLERIVYSLQLPDLEQSHVAEVLREYAVNLDGALTTWEAEHLALEARRLASGVSARDRMNGGIQAERKRSRHRSASRRLDALIQAVRDVNVAFVERLASKLDEPARRELHEAVDRIDYPTVFVTDPAERLFRAMDEYGAPDSERRNALQHMEMTFMERRHALRQELIRAIQRARDSEELERFATQRKLLVAQGLDPDELADALFRDDPRTSALQKRREHVVEVTSRIRSLFTSKEIELMPAHLRLLLSWTPR